MTPGPNSVIQRFHLIDVFLHKSTQYPAKGRFIRNPSPTCRTAQNMVIPNRHDRTYRTCATNNSDEGQKNHVYRVV
jgi:hypothetical protein